MLGVNPASGRLIVPEDVRADDESPVAVLSFGIWQRVFGAGPQIAGKRILLNAYSFTVVGVVAAPFEGTTAGSRAGVIRVDLR